MLWSFQVNSEGAQPWFLSPKTHFWLLTSKTVSIALSSNRKLIQLRTLNFPEIHGHLRLSYTFPPLMEKWLNLSVPQFPHLSNGYYNSISPLPIGSLWEFSELLWIKEGWVPNNWCFRVVVNWLTGWDPDAGKDWRQKEKGSTEDEDGWIASSAQWTWVWANSRR